MWQVLNEANLTNAVLVRSVLTRSDLGGAIIEGADFSDAVIDLPQKQVHSYVNDNAITYRCCYSWRLSGSMVNAYVIS